MVDAVRYSHLRVLHPAARKLAIKSSNGSTPTIRSDGAWQALVWQWRDLATIPREKSRPGWYVHYLFRLAERSGGGAAGDASRLAQGGLPALLAMEVAGWTAAASEELRELIRRIAEENPVWGQERIANELLLKLGLRVSRRTVAK
jgi:hypothetical protein